MARSPFEALIRRYDEKWSTLDFAGLADLWVRADPPPVYIGDEYPAPLVGADQLDRHWARVVSRLRSASVASELWSVDVLAGGLARCVLLSRWSFTGLESDTPRDGASWITWLLATHDAGYRIFHHMESQVYFVEGFTPEPERRPGR